MRPPLLASKVSHSTHLLQDDPSQGLMQLAHFVDDMGIGSPLRPQHGAHRFVTPSPDTRTDPALATEVDNWVSLSFKYEAEHRHVSTDLRQSDK
jgi:hypothetical protein